MQNLYGLIGFPLTHSFSKKYFTGKFQDENIRNATYELFPLEEIAMLEELLAKKENLRGLNVTIPYKEKVYDYILEKGGSIDITDNDVKAVNVIKIHSNGKLIGYNSDVDGFERSLLEFMNDNGQNRLNEILQNNKGALVLGNGGAAKAVLAILKKEKVNYKIVTRHKGQGDYTYEELNKEIIDAHPLIINTTPLGTHPNVTECPNIPYQFLTGNHFLFDLVYNPPVTTFMQKGRDKGAKVINGYNMLVYQAEKAWEIWNTPIR